MHNWIELDGAVNVRDLGGLQAKGGVTRHGVLLRGDNMAKVTAADVMLLIGKYRLTRLIDLRSAGETRETGESPLCDHGVTVDHLPLVDEAGLQRRSAMLRHAAKSLAGMPVANAYDEFLSLGRDAIARAVSTLASDGGTPALVHCTVGRDRTGVLVAILLDAAGVDRTAIVADYAATGEKAALLAHRLSEMSGYEQDAVRATAANLVTRPETMEAFLKVMDDRFGGTRAWLLGVGVGAQTLDRWRDILIAQR